MTTAATSVTAASIGSTTTVLSVLSQASANATATANTVELNQIKNLIQTRLTNQIAALETTSDSATTNALTAQINGLQSQQSSIAKLEAQWGNNANIFPSLNTALSQLQTYAANGDSADFDATLAAANTYVGDLTAIVAPAPFQPDQVSNLKENGLGIGNSASYDLSTPSGQAAAEAAVNSAQGLVGNIFALTKSNQLVAGDIVTSLTTQIGNLSALQQQSQSATDTATQNKIAALTEQAQNQEHLIELSLGSTQTIASMVYNATNPPQPVTSVFQALQDAVGATPSSYSPSNSAPAILSLLT